MVGQGVLDKPMRGKGGERREAGGQRYSLRGLGILAAALPFPLGVLKSGRYRGSSRSSFLLAGSRPEDALMGLASGPWGVAYRQFALCSADEVLQIWVKYPAGTEFICGLESPVLKKSVFTPVRTFFCEQESPIAPLPDAGETPLGIRIILIN